MSARPCSEGCGHVAVLRGLCRPCYSDRARAGTLPAVDFATHNGPTLPDYKALGLSYRQLDYWTRSGRIHADEPTPGSGHRRTWPDEEIAVAGRIARLIAAGLSLEIAAGVARDPDTDIELQPGVVVRIATIPDPATDQAAHHRQDLTA